MESNEGIKLHELAGGAVAEAFEHELGLVLENILDPNTPAANKREVSIKVKISPAEDRSLGDVEIITTSKLAPSKGLMTRMFFGRDRKSGKIAASEFNPMQGDMFADSDEERAHEGDNVVPMAREQKG